jgi:diaminohydroxyphosphoribosylaminopyrimidine deaminase/5-amino-6-(5-phosphoribosylamino)uracil reductase
MMVTLLDQHMMQRAIALAERGRYSTQPNPRVGCVIVQGERIIGEGAHLKAGEPHAEVFALRAAGSAAKGATAYVTLEPHSHQGRTPPCTEALIRAGVSRVVCGTLDPNPLVHGNGVRQLTDAGIEVATGLLEAQVRELNLGFEKRMRHGVPRVMVKIAASLDGRVALANGASRWITGEAARADVQRLRAQSSAILTGIETVLADDPQLTVRDASLETLGRQPLRVVLDSSLRMPVTARMLREAGETLVVTSSGDAARAAELQRAGAAIATVQRSGDGLNLQELLRELGTRQCNDVLVEAGPTLAGRFVELGLLDELILYVAPRLLGPDARAMLQLPTLQHLDQSSRFRLKGSEQIGDDLKLTLIPISAAIRP